MRRASNDDCQISYSICIGVLKFKRPYLIKSDSIPPSVSRPQYSTTVVFVSLQALVPDEGVEIDFDEDRNCYYYLGSRVQSVTRRNRKKKTYINIFFYMVILVKRLSCIMIGI